MENNSESLHVQKVAILSRLIKETSLTLEEALLLLKEEDKEEKSISVGTSGYGTLTVGSYSPLGTWSTGTSTSTTYVTPPSFISMSGSSTINNTAEESADLNN
jgi:hypothetical protein